MRAFLYSILVLIGYVAMPSHAATYYGGLCGAGGLVCASDGLTDLCNKAYNYSYSTNTNTINPNPNWEVPYPGHPEFYGACLIYYKSTHITATTNGISLTCLAGQTCQGDGLTQNYTPESDPLLSNFSN